MRRDYSSYQSTTERVVAARNGLYGREIEDREQPKSFKEKRGGLPSVGGLGKEPPNATSTRETNVGEE